MPKTFAAVLVALLFTACGGVLQDPLAPRYTRASPLTPVPLPPDAGPTPWTDVQPEGTLDGLQAYAACKDSCPGAVDVEFYAASDYCTCTCADGSDVDGHLYQRKFADELADLWKAVCKG